MAGSEARRFDPKPEEVNKKQARSPERLAFISRNKEGKVVEEPIVPLTAETTVEVERTAEIFAGLLKEDRRGKLRVPESALQNRITRAIMQGKLKDPIGFRKQLKVAVINKLGKQASVEVDNVLMGIQANCFAIELMEQEFRIQEGTAAEHMIGTNDRLDAGQKIDLIDVRFEKTDAGRNPKKIILAQTKSSPLTPEEVSAIHMKHQEYYDSILSRSEEEQRIMGSKESETRETLLSGKYFEDRMAGERTDAGRLEFMQTYFEPLFLEYISENADKVDGQAVKAMIERSAQAIPVGMVRLLFDKEGSRAFFRLVAERILVSEEDRKRIDGLFDRLHDWASAEPIGHDELKELHPDWKPFDNLVEATAFESVVYHGKARSSAPLIPKTLRDRRRDRCNTRLKRKELLGRVPL